jgi:hypothetical protein
MRGLNRTGGEADLEYSRVQGCAPGRDHGPGAVRVIAVEGKCARVRSLRSRITSSMTVAAVIDIGDQQRDGVVGREAGAGAGRDQLGLGADQAGALTIS